MEQAEQFKYLGVIFQVNLSWKVHLNSAIRTAMSTRKAVLRLYYSSGGQYIPAPVKAFQC